MRLQALLPPGKNHQFLFRRSPAGDYPVDKCLQVEGPADLRQGPSPDDFRSHIEKGGRRPVHREDPPLHIDGDDPLHHSGKERLLLVPPANDGVDPLRKLAGHSVHRHGQTAEMSRIGNGKAIAELSPGKGLRPLPHLDERAAETEVKQQSHPCGKEGNEDNADKGPVLRRGKKIVKMGHGNGCPDDPDHPSRLPDRLGPVHHSLLQGAAEPERSPHPLFESGFDLGTVTVVFHLPGISIRVSQHLAAGQDQGDPCHRLPAEFPADPFYRGRVFSPSALHQNLGETGPCRKLLRCTIQEKILQRHHRIPARGTQR